MSRTLELRTVQLSERHIFKRKINTNKEIILQCNTYYASRDKVVNSIVLSRTSEKAVSTPLLTSNSPFANHSFLCMLSSPYFVHAQ